MMRNIKEQLIKASFVEDLVVNFNGSAHVKDATTGVYVVSNLANIKKLGLTKPEEIYGSTVFDLDCYMRPFWGELANDIDKFDQNVIVEKNRAFIAPTGRVYVHTMKKFPVLNNKNNVSNILTVNENITSQLGALQLWDFYKRFYITHSKHIAIQNFLQHIGLFQCFDELPTEAELFVLLTKQKFPTAKEMATQLNVSVRTIETHLSRLRNKSKFDLTRLLNQILIID